MEMRVRTCHNFSLLSLVSDGVKGWCLATMKIFREKGHSFIIPSSYTYIYIYVHMYKRHAKGKS